MVDKDMKTILEAIEDAQESKYEWAHIYTKKRDSHFVMLEKLASKLKESNNYKKLLLDKKVKFDKNNGLINVDDKMVIFLHPFRVNFFR